jgi:hypothetical protein
MPLSVIGYGDTHKREIKLISAIWFPGIKSVPSNIKIVLNNFMCSSLKYFLTSRLRYVTILCQYQLIMRSLYAFSINFNIYICFQHD